MPSRYTTGTIGTQRHRNIASNVRFELEGDWILASRVINNLPQDLKKALVLGQLAYAKAYQKALRNNIKSNGALLGWAPLEESYKKWKNRQNEAFGSESIGRFTGQMYKAIGIYQSGYKVSVGISKDDSLLSKSEGLTTAQYALIFERGSFIMNIPPRPLFSPTFHQLGGRAGVSRTVVGAIQASYLIKYKIKL